MKKNNKNESKTNERETERLNGWMARVSVLFSLEIETKVGKMPPDQTDAIQSWREIQMKKRQQLNSQRVRLGKMPIVSDFFVYAK